MPSVQYLNQSAPFWDFVASLEEQGQSHPLFSAFNSETRGGGNNFPWGGFAGYGRSRGDGGPPPHHGAPPPPGVPSPPDVPSPEGPPHHEGPPEYDGPPPPWEGRRGRRGHSHRRGGGCGGGRGGHWGGGPFSMNPIAQFLQSQFGANAEDKSTEESNEFTPQVDVFDTEEAYIVHASLPGAKKEDVGVNWDSDKSELSIAGVVYRPGDEELLKTLAMSERKVGVFDKKIRLGSRANPAAVDQDAISAKMEDGVLRITIPKQDKEYVEVKMVDIE